MAPRPLSTTIRTSRHSQKPSIFAISSGPQRGVHLLSTESVPPDVQYRYRQPINIHRTMLTLSGDFLRKRFESIDDAIAWLDERERERELSELLAGSSITGTTAAAAASSGDSEAGRQERDKRERRKSDPIWVLRSPVSGGGIEKKTPEKGKIVAVRGRYGMSHLGVRRRELLYDRVAGEVEERPQHTGDVEVAALSPAGGDAMEVEEEL